MLRQRLICVARVLLAAGCGTVSAQMAFTTQPLPVFAGPSTSYPLVAQLPPGVHLHVLGCLSDWSWCDVMFGGNRGWAFAPNLSYTFQGAPVPLYSYAPRLGIPVVPFVLGSYWDRFYRGRPWYSQRDMWARRAPPPRFRPGWRPPPGQHFRPGPPVYARPFNPPPHFDTRPGPPGARPPFDGPGARPPFNDARPPGGGRPDAGPGPGRPGAQRPDGGPGSRPGGNQQRPSSGPGRERPGQGPSQRPGQGHGQGADQGLGRPGSGPHGQRPDSQGQGGPPH